MEATAEKYAELFNTMGILSDAGVMAYRTKTIKSGKMLEAELFPIYAGRAECIRLKEQKKKISAEVMQEANERNSWKRMNRRRRLLVHADIRGGAERDEGAGQAGHAQFYCAGAAGAGKAGNGKNEIHLRDRVGGDERKNPPSHHHGENGLGECAQAVENGENRGAAAAGG